MDSDRWERKRERWERRWERRRARYHSPGKHLATGIILLGIGVIFLLGNMGYLDVREYFAFWPVILIVFGVVRMIEGRSDYAHSSGMFWVVIGLLFLLGSIGVIRIAIHDLWPILLIGLGILMLWRSLLVSRERARLRNTSSGNESWFFDAKATDGPASDTSQSQSKSQSNPVLSATAVLAGLERRINSQDFQGGDVTTVLGGCMIDLRGASIVPPRQPVLHLFALFGGIEIRVPPDWTIVSELEVILGGFDDRKTDPPKDESKRLIIRGTVLMGGVEVRN
jgi:predicted membrane protein